MNDVLARRAVSSSSSHWGPAHALSQSAFSSMLCLTLMLALTPRAAFAHDADVIGVAAAPAPGGMVEQVTLTQPSLLLLAPIDADHNGVVSEAELADGAAAINAGLWLQMPMLSDEKPCEINQQRASIREAVVDLQATFTCPPGALRQTFRYLSILPAAYRVDLVVQVGAELKTQSARAPMNTLSLARPSSSAPQPAGASLAAVLALLALWILLALVTSDTQQTAMVRAVIGGVALMVGHQLQLPIVPQVLVSMVCLTIQVLALTRVNLGTALSTGAALALGSLMQRAALPAWTMGTAAISLMIFSLVSRRPNPTAARVFLAIAWLVAGFQLAATAFP